MKPRRRLPGTGGATPGVWLAASVLFALGSLGATACDVDPLTDSSAGPSPDAADDPSGGAEEPTLTEPPARAVRRMTVDQLAASIPVVTGGIAWVEDFGQGEQDMLQVLAQTLGAPDYIRVTEENLEPSIIIAKFMADAASRVCPMWVKRDRDRPPGERTLIVHDDWASTAPEDVARSLRALQLRAFARYVPEGDDTGIAEMQALFDEAASASQPAQAATNGWLAVCMATLTDPAFVLY